MWDMLAGGSPTNPIYPAFRSMGIEPPLPPTAAASRRDAMQDIWQRAGLQEIETQVIRIPIAFDEFWETISLPIGPQGMMIQKMSPNVREQLRKHAREKVPTNSSGRIAYEAFANAVKGRRAG
jgi:allophanate hydrolase subunit 1